MPTYEYKCTKCGHTFEAFQSMMDKPLSKCPVCKSAVRRVINGGMAVIFKGSGFYSTDNKRGSALSGGNGHSKDKDREKSSESSRDSTSEKSSSEKSSSEKSSEKPPTEKSSSKEKTPAS
jgi:putative FmdB family regulatory protein